LKSPDQTDTELPSINALRQYWKNQSKVLQQRCAALADEAWFEKHTAVSAEDFSKEPHRNKLNIIITRTSHLQYHMGQMVLLKS